MHTQTYLRLRARRTLVGLVAAALLLGVGLAPAVSAEPKAKSVKTVGEFIEYNADGPYVVVKVTRPGSGKDAKRLRRGRPAKFKVKPEGSVLTRTTVAIRGRTGKLTDIAAGKTVNVYWRPDEKNGKIRFARKIDVILSEAEWDELYPGE